MRYLIIISLLISANTYGQSPHEYICDEFNGTISEKIEGRDFVGTTYECTVKEQWDMQIQSRLNELIISNPNFDNARDWDKTYVSPESYNRRAFALELDGLHIVNVYIPYGVKTDSFFIAAN